MYYTPPRAADHLVVIIMEKKNWTPIAVMNGILLTIKNSGRAAAVLMR